MTDKAVRFAAQAVLDAADAYRDALNGAGHPGEDHDTWLREPRDPNAAFHIYDTVGDCSACGGAQYGTEDALTQAYGDLRAALGHDRLPWEFDRSQGVA